MIRTLCTLLVQELHRPRRRPAARQTRTCQFCNAWFNTPALQDAHERDCDQRPVDVTPAQAAGLTPAQVVELAFPSHGRGLPDRYAHEFARDLLGRWAE